jgi:hypothetical protein
VCYVHYVFVTKLSSNIFTVFAVIVSTWEGERSQIDKEVISERRNAQKRSWHDHYEEELDMGKVQSLTH